MYAPASCPLLPGFVIRRPLSPGALLTLANTNRAARGMAGPTGMTIAQVGAGVATTVAHTLVALGTVTGPVGLAIAGIAEAGVLIASLFQGCGQTCVAATNIANQAGTIIDNAYTQYMNSPIHYKSMQTAYLQLFDQTMQAMDQACSNPQLGAAGQRCISDRQASSCAYKTSPGGWHQDSAGQWSWTEAGANGSGTACWNSYIGRRDPVANDPTVVPDPGSVSASVSSLFGGGTSSTGGLSLSSLLIPAALVAVAWWAFD